MPSSRLLPGPSIQSLPIQVCQFEEKQFQSFVDPVPLIIQDKDNILSSSDCLATSLQLQQFQPTAEIDMRLPITSTYLRR